MSQALRATLGWDWHWLIPHGGDKLQLHLLPPLSLRREERGGREERRSEAKEVKPTEKSAPGHSPDGHVV